MRFFSRLSWGIFCLLAACTGAGVGGPPSAMPPAGIANHAAPGMDEVAVAPSAEYEDGSKNYLTCENIDSPDAKPDLATVKLHVFYNDEVAPDRWIRVTESNENRYRYLKTDAEGYFTFTYEVVTPRGLNFQILDTAPATDIPLDTTFPCTDQFCVASVSDPVKTHLLQHIDKSCDQMSGRNPPLSSTTFEKPLSKDNPPSLTTPLDKQIPLKGTLDLIDTK